MPQSDDRREVDRLVDSAVQEYVAVRADDDPTILLAVAPATAWSRLCATSAIAAANPLFDLSIGIDTVLGEAVSQALGGGIPIRRASRQVKVAEGRT